MTVPEQHIREVIKVIRTGLGFLEMYDPVSEVVKKKLKDWCNEKVSNEVKRGKSILDDM